MVMSSDCPQNPLSFVSGFPSAEAVMAAGNRLREQGLWVAAVRPPTVPTSRLRITVMATHQRSHLDRLVEALADL